MASVEARKTPERLMRAQEAKNKHQLFFERVENEVSLFIFFLTMLKLCLSNLKLFCHANSKKLITFKVMRYKAVHRHHMQCLKVLMLKSVSFFHAKIF